MTTEQVKNVAFVYRKLMENEVLEWGELDEQLEILEWLRDDELFKEAQILQMYHEKEGIVCHEEHGDSECFFVMLDEAANSIIKLYEETKHLHKNNKYILQYYLAMEHVGLLNKS